MSSAMISVRDLVFEYPTTRALHGVSFDVNAGSITALVGPNGSGKTTLLRCLAALERPYAGRVVVDGIDVAENPRRVHRRLGFLPDFFGLYDALTVAQCLTFAARSHGIGARAARAAVEKAAQRVDLSDRMGDAAGTLSRGLRQRLAIGQVIVHEPSVLLLDEPASGLDPEARRSLSTLLLDLQSQGMTLMVSSHILAELEDYSSQMLIMKEGRLTGGDPIQVEAAAQRIMIELAEPHDGLGAYLQDQAGVTVRRADAQGALISLDGDAQAQHRLLRALIEAGFVVCSFAPTQQRLEDVYFDEMHGGRS